MENTPALYSPLQISHNFYSSKSHLFFFLLSSSTVSKFQFMITTPVEPPESLPLATKLAGQSSLESLKYYLKYLAYHSLFMANYAFRHTTCQIQDFENIPWGPSPLYFRALYQQLGLSFGHQTSDQLHLYFSELFSLPSSAYPTSTQASFKLYEVLGILF